MAMTATDLNERKLQTAATGKQSRFLPFVMVLVVCLLGGGFFYYRSLSAAPDKDQSENLYDLGSIITNLSVNSDLKYISTKVALELSNTSMEEEVKNKEPVLRDSIINLLNNRTSQEINTNRSQLKREALVLLNRHLRKGRITEIYFSDLIMQ